MRVTIRKLNFRREDRATFGSGLEVGRGGVKAISFATALNGHYTVVYTNDRVEAIPMTSVLTADIEVNELRSMKHARSVKGELYEAPSEELKQDFSVAQASDEGSSEP